MHEIFYNNPLDIEIKSFTEVNGFIFPLRINIADIKYSYTDVRFLKVNIAKTPDKDVLVYGENSSPFKEQYNIGRYFSELEFIYQFIDWELTDKNFNTFNDIIGVEDVKEFKKWFMNFHIFNIESIVLISDEIRYLLDCVKIEFVNKLTKLFELDREEPKIRLKDNSETPKEYLPFLSYNYNMTSFQTVSEFPMTIWFPENVNKAYTDWSWREQEAKRMYITAKTKVENFRELVKAKQVEEIYDKK